MGLASATAETAAELTDVLEFLPDRDSNWFKPSLGLIADLSAIGITAAFDADAHTYSLAQTNANLTVEHNAGRHLMYSERKERKKSLQKITEALDRVEGQLSQMGDFENKDALIFEWRALKQSLKNYSDVIDSSSRFQEYLPSELRQPRLSKQGQVSKKLSRRRDSST